MRCIVGVLGSSWRLHNQAVPMPVYHSVRTWFKTGCELVFPLFALALDLQEVPLSTLHSFACQRTLCSYSSIHGPYHALLVRHVHHSAQEAWCVFSVRGATQQGLR